METIRVSTPVGSSMTDVTELVQGAVVRAEFATGLCVLFMPHTTASLTLNEHWDPDVQHDFILKMDELVANDPRFRHSEGNSAAHIKSSLFDASLVLMVHDGQIRLGRWQGVYLVDWDGPRRREVWVTLLPSDGQRKWRTE